MENLKGNLMLRRAFLRFMAGGVVAGIMPLPSVRAKDGPKPETVGERLGEATTRILNGATRVEAFRVGDKPAEKPEGKQVGGYAVLSAAGEKRKDFAKRLASLVQDEKSLFSAQARCFSPGVAFRLWNERESVDVVVCYKCWGLRLTARDAAGKVLHRTGGGFKENFDAWVKLAKAAFPDDNEMQGLEGGERL
jgi:hypothetical protein